MVQQFQGLPQNGKNVNLKRFGFSPNHPGLPTRVNSNNVVLLQRKHQILPKAKLTNLFTMLMCKRCQNANKKIKPIHTSQYFSCSTRVWEAETCILQIATPATMIMITGWGGLWSSLTVRKTVMTIIMTTLATLGTMATVLNHHHCHQWRLITMACNSSLKWLQIPNYANLSAHTIIRALQLPLKRTNATESDIMKRVLQKRINIEMPWRVNDFLPTSKPSERHSNFKLCSNIKCGENWHRSLFT